MTNTHEPEIASVKDASSAENQISYKIGDWVLYTHSNQLLGYGRAVELEYRLTSLMVFLLNNKDRILSKNEILKAVWPKKVVNDDSVAVAISQLRKALDDNPRTPTYIKTIPGVGYQFIWQSNEDLSVANAAPSAITLPRMSQRVYLISVLLIALVSIGLFYVKFNAEHPKATASELELMPSSETYQKAEKYLAGEDVEKTRQSVKLFRDIIGHSPNSPESAPAYLGLAEAKMKLVGDQVFQTDNYLEISGILQRSLELDPKLARAHLWLGDLIFGHERNIVEAERHFKTSVELAPKDALVRDRYAHFLVIHKRFAEAREQINAVRRINPLSFPMTNMVWFYLLQGNNELAARELERIESTEEGDKYFKIAAQNVYYNAGDEKKTYENMQWFFKQANFSAEKIARLDAEFSRGGLAAVYQWLLDTKEAADIGQYTPPISWARYAVGAGQKQLAIDYLAQAFEKKQPHVECAAADPRYAPLYKEQGFQLLMNKFSSPIK
jgi:DNA-binding winged helix-turn-helix (wHTH) protein/Tfp pilus assembly protein PilF